MLAVVPLCAVPLTAWWDGIASLPSGAVFPLQAQTIGEQVWLVEIGAQTDGAGSGVAPGGLVGLAIAPLAAPDWPADVASEAPVIRVSDRGWIGEPWDTVAPNTPYPPRLAEPVALEASLPIYPDTVRRLAVTTGEVRLLNGDGQLDALAGDWAVAGQTVTLHRGPHWRPLHAPLAAFVRIATLRAAGAAVGTSRLAIPLRPAAAALDVPVCATYAGSGGAEGPATLTGQFKPRLYGLKRNIDPVLVDPGLLLFQVHDGSIDSILAVRDRGVALTNAGDLAHYAALASASVSSGTFKTCLATGMLRVGATPSSLTVDARGDNDAGTGGYNTGSPPGIAAKLLRGPGGIAAADSARFVWPVGEAGLWLRGGTVEAALEALAVGVFGWWGTDTDGAYQGGQLTPPEDQVPGLTIEPWMLAAPPEEIGPPRPPWWRVRIGYQALGRIQTDEQLAPAVSATDRDAYGKASRTAPALDAGISAAYPSAVDGPDILSVFDLAADAQPLADQLLAVFGRPRRMFQARIRSGAGGFSWPTMQLGACVALRWPQHRALAAGRPLIVQGVSARGDATTLTLWG